MASIFFYKHHWKTFIIQYLIPPACTTFLRLSHFLKLSSRLLPDLTTMWCIYNDDDDDDYFDEKNPLINKKNCPRFWAWLPLVEAKEKLQLWKTFTSLSMSRGYCFTRHPPPPHRPPIGKHFRPSRLYQSPFRRTCSYYWKSSSSLSAMSTPIQRLPHCLVDASWICINVKVLSCPWSPMSSARWSGVVHHVQTSFSSAYATEHPYT